MDLVNRKYHFMERLMNIDSIEKLEKLERFFNAEIEEDQGQIPEFLQKLINKGIEDVAAGKVHSSEEVHNKIKKKYGL